MLSGSLKCESTGPSKAGKAQAVPHILQMSMGDIDHPQSIGSSALLPLTLLYIIYTGTTPTGLNFLLFGHTEDVLL